MKSLKERMSKSFVCQPTMVVDQARTQEFFRTEEVSKNKATLRNISTSTNKQKALSGKIWVFFNLDTTKTVYLVRNLPIDPRNLGILHDKQGHCSSPAVCACLHIFMSFSEKGP